jgi:hypothetical protein
MHAEQLWRSDPIVIELGMTDAALQRALDRHGFTRRLGVCDDGACAARLQSAHPELAAQIAYSRRRKLVLNNNAEVLVLSGRRALWVYKYESVRHAQWAAWPARFGLISLVALVGCLWHFLGKRFSWPRIVTVLTPEGRKVRLFTSRILRRKTCRRKSLHFIPHAPGLAGLFRQFDDRQVQYVVLRWFESLPEVAPDEDVDLLVDDESLPRVLEIFDSQPGIVPCDLYSASGLARSAYCGTPYYPPHLAERILHGAERRRGQFCVPNGWDYFHSLAYHAVYHKGTRSNLPRGATGLTQKPKSQHDFVSVLTSMALELGIDAEISLEGLHVYLQSCGWGPPAEALCRLAAACPGSAWLQLIAARVDPALRDEGFTVFVVRREALRRGFYRQIVAMIAQAGFEVLASHVLAEAEVEHAAARSRGGNWTEEGPFDLPSGPPAAVVVAYDPAPLPMTRRQRRKFIHRTNGRIFCKEAIRDAVIAQLPRGQSFNALHSSDNAADAWHLIDVLAPDLASAARARLGQAADAPGDAPQRLAA